MCITSYEKKFPKLQMIGKNLFKNIYDDSLKISTSRVKSDHLFEITKLLFYKDEYTYLFVLHGY